MSTVNIQVADDWTLLVAAGDDFLLSVPGVVSYDIEVAVSDAETDPDIDHGHLLHANRSEAMNRALIGPGHVYARAVSDTTAVAVVSAWTP